MNRPIQICRDEAELLVDLLEKNGLMLALELAANIRAEFGMVTREREAQLMAERLVDWHRAGLVHHVEP